MTPAAWRSRPPPTGPATQFTYDRSGLLVGRQIGAETIRYAYDGARRVTAETDSRGNRGSLEYGPMGHLVAMVTPIEGRIAFEYDQNGVLKRATRGDGSVAFTRLPMAR